MNENTKPQMDNDEIQEFINDMNFYHAAKKAYDDSKSTFLHHQRVLMSNVIDEMKSSGKVYTSGEISQSLRGLLTPTEIALYLRHKTCEVRSTGNLVPAKRFFCECDSEGNPLSSAVPFSRWIKMAGFQSDEAYRKARREHYY